MLSQNFVDWWFSPWEYAASIPDLGAPAADRLGYRDGYRLWCSAAHVTPDLPTVLTPSWESAAYLTDVQLLAAARLFAGLIAAREHDAALLSALSFVDRKWCVSVAATQPLRRCREDAQVSQQSPEVCGLTELAQHLNHGFPGMWSRLRITLPSAQRLDLDAAVSMLPPEAERMDAIAVRAQRCWRMCRNRIVAAEIMAGPEQLREAA